ncbi:MAG: hypothetical protein QXQ29_02640 [Candidatus Bathyarchaeia archaeon]
MKSMLFCLWLLTNILAAKELVIVPLLTAQSAVQLFRYAVADNIVKVECTLDKPLYFESDGLLANFTLLGKPDGYRVRAYVGFVFSCDGVGAEGFYRINITAYCNGREAYRILRDEEIVSSGGSHGAIEIPIDTELIKEGNTLLISIQLTSILRQYGTGLAILKLGPIDLAIESIDADLDKIPDPIDNLPVNNQMIFIMLLLTTSLILIAAFKKLRNSVERL